jgi:hypothetical protein
MQIGEVQCSRLALHALQRGTCATWDSATLYTHTLSLSNPLLQKRECTPPRLTYPSRVALSQCCIGLHAEVTD